jgi:hypothetical protein
MRERLPYWITLGIFFLGAASYHFRPADRRLRIA